uniref:Ig-like domain-containing protein n=1 Tax=Seriola dumerili TaxID=41447 RepID=A0A3B4V5M1_SERDU
MKSFILISALLLCWISVSVSQSQTVEVQPGGDVTLLCSNISSFPAFTFWSRLYNKTNIGCISSISNMSTIFLIIKQVGLSDSGLYLCGVHVDGHAILTVIDLIVQGRFWLSFAETVFLMVIIGLVVKYRKLQTAHNEEHNPQKENPASDDLNYTALSFHSEAKGSRGRPSERELGPDVLQAATRWSQEISGTAAQRGSDALSFCAACALEELLSLVTTFVAIPFVQKSTFVIKILLACVSIVFCLTDLVQLVIGV